MSKSGQAFVPRDKLNYAGRVCETYLRKKLYRWEDRSALALYKLLQKNAAAIRDFALTQAGYLRLTEVGNDRDSIVFRRLLNTYVEAQLVAYGQQAAQIAYRYASTAFAAGWYGRLWMLDQASHHDPRVKPERMPQGLAARSVLSPGLTEALDDGGAGAWADTYENAVTASIVKVKRLVNNTAAAPLGVLALTQAVDTALGVDTAPRQASKGLYHAVALPTRTAVMRSANHASAEVYKSHTEMLLGAMWVTSHDERVCFPAFTQVETIKGKRFIQRLSVGDYVATRNGYQRVKAVSKRPYSGDMVLIRTSIGMVISTADHPYWTLEKGWLQGCDLNADYTLQSVNNQPVKIKRIVNINFGNADNIPSIIMKIFIFALISCFVTMPVNAVNLKSYALFLKKKINAVSSKFSFLNIRNIE